MCTVIVLALKLFFVSCTGVAYILVNLFIWRTGISCD
jgi:hypothetical protein